MITGTKAQLAQPGFEHDHEHGNPGCSTTSLTSAPVEENTPVPPTGPNAATVPSIVKTVKQPFLSQQLNHLR